MEQRFRRERVVVAGRYEVELVYDGEKLIGAYVTVPALGMIYIPRRERVIVPRLSKRVKRFLARYGFQVL